MRSKRISMAVVATGAVALIAAAAEAGKAPAPPAASTYAPADDLSTQIDFYLKHIDEVLGDKNEFDDAAITRLKKDGNTLVALFLTLGMHDTKTPMSDRAADLVALTQNLAAAKDYDSAKKTLAAIRETMTGNAAPPGKPRPLNWEKAASLEQLMKQVPSINSALKRSVTAERFAKMHSQSAAQSATLAAIAQTVMADTSAVKNPKDLDKWYAACAEMRDAAGAVNVAVHAENLDATSKAMAKLAASCETCHAVFRNE